MFFENINILNNFINLKGLDDSLFKRVYSFMGNKLLKYMKHFFYMILFRGGKMSPIW